jgi:hypothetical protein
LPPAVDAGAPPAEGAATVAGYVHDAFGRPVQKANVRISRSAGSSFSELGNVATGADGRFSRALPEGKVMVEVSAAGFQTRLLEGIALAAGETRELDILLAAGERLQGRVVDDSNEPVRGAEITAIPSRVDSAGDAMTTSDADGRFSFEELAQGSYCLHATKSPLVDAELCGQRPGAAVTLRLTRPGAVAGRVVHGLGFRPVVKFAVSVRPSGRAEESMVPTRVRDVVSQSGEFRVEGLAPGLYHVSVVSGGRLYAERDRVEVRAGETAGPLTFELVAGGRVSGLLVSAPDGSPVSGATVELLLGEVGSHRVLKATSDEAGRFEFDNVTEGTHRLNVEHPGFEPLLLKRLAREQSRGEPFTLRLKPQKKR